VGGDFSCSHNQLTSLEGAPREVRGDFRCDANGLTSLKGAPEKVGGDFWCHNNRLTSLEGAPREVRVSFWCDNNQLTSLEGAPEKVEGDFTCSRNPISQQTLKMIHSKMQETPGMPYGAVLVALQSKISKEDWEKLDKSSLEKLPGRSREVYKLLGGIGAI